jgi:hypothetical protein
LNHFENNYILMMPIIWRRGVEVGVIGFRCNYAPT